jgi:uncharacterized protein Yka (UPF0111/DUF47 family)
MFSLQKLLGKEDMFFDLLEASAEEGRNCVRALNKLLSSPDRARTLEDFVASRRKEKKIANQISEAVATTFVTALEREDIEALSFALYRIPKTIEKIAERILLAPHLMADVDLSRQLSMMEKSTDALLLMLKELRRGVNLEKIKGHNDDLQAIEGEADKLALDLLRDLFSGKHDPLKAVFLKELFDLLEKVTDRCRDAGNVINHIVLKNS